jgi:hypothetical protein
VNAVPDARFYRASLVLAPLLLLASSLSLTALHNDNADRLRQIAEQPDRYFLFCLLGILGSIALIPASYALMVALRPHRARTAVVAGLLTVLSTGLALVDYGTELVKWQAGRKGTDVAAMTALLDRVDASAGMAALLQVSGLAYLAGIVVFAIGLRRARLVPLWVSLGLVAGLFLNLFGFASGSIAVLDASGAVLVLSMGAAGRALPTEPVALRAGSVPVTA